MVIIVGDIKPLMDDNGIVIQMQMHSSSFVISSTVMIFREVYCESIMENIKIVGFQLLEFVIWLRLLGFPYTNILIRVFNKPMGASIVKWTKQVLKYTKAVVFLVKGL